MVEDIRAGELAAVLDLNNLHAVELSLLDAAQLADMVDGAFAARRIGDVEAFLIAFDQDAAYGSPNFHWFRARLPRFVYIDRVLVAEAARGRGHARRLYDELFAAARAAGHDTVCCEINEQPPNPASHAFHAALGFREVGAAAIHGGAKHVRYFTRALDP